MSPEQRVRRMLDALPLLLQEGQNVRRLLDALAGELSVMENGVTRVLRSRWYALASPSAVLLPVDNKRDQSLASQGLAVDPNADLARLAALFGLEPVEGEDAAYFRRHLASFVALHRTGLFSAAAVLRLISFVYLAQQPPEIFWDGDVAVGRFKVPLPEGGFRTLRVELFDNPEGPALARFHGVRAGFRLVVQNGGLDPSIPEIRLTAPSDRDVAVPILTHLDAGLDVIFVGVVPRGKTLTLRHAHTPLIDGQPVTDPVLLANPSRWSSDPPTDRVWRFDAPDARFSVFDRDYRLPALPPGDNRFTYDTLSRERLRSYLSFWPDLSSVLEKANEAEDAPPVNLEFRWTEVAPATFALRIPVDYVPARFADTGLAGLTREIARVLERARAAGVRARIELTLPLPAEAVDMDEAPVSVDMAAAFREDATASDALVAVGSGIDLAEALPQPEERLFWSGYFNATRFDTSRFQ